MPGKALERKAATDVRFILLKMKIFVVGKIVL